MSANVRTPLKSPRGIPPVQVMRCGRLELRHANRDAAARAEGTRRLYRLHDEGIEAVRACLEEVWGDAANRFKRAADNR